MDTRPACMTPEVCSGALSSWTCRVPGKLRPCEHRDARCGGWGRGPLRVAASPGRGLLSSLSRPEAASAHRERSVSARTCTGPCPGHRGQQRGSIRGRAERRRGPQKLGAAAGRACSPGGSGAAPALCPPPPPGERGRGWAHGRVSLREVSAPGGEPQALAAAGAALRAGPTQPGEARLLAVKECV